MAQVVKKMAAWLGLISDDHDDRFGDDVEQFSEPVYRHSSIRETEEASVVTPIRRGKSDAEQARGDTPVFDQHRSDMIKADLSRIITVHPRNYNEARTIGEHFRDGVPVIMNLSDMDDSDAKRLVDFAAGLIFGLRGTIERVTSKVFLLSPTNVNVTAEDKERIKGGFYNQS